MGRKADEWDHRVTDPDANPMSMVSRVVLAGLATVMCFGILSADRLFVERLIREHGSGEVDSVLDVAGTVVVGRIVLDDPVTELAGFELDGVAQEAYLPPTASEYGDTLWLEVAPHEGGWLARRHGVRLEPRATAARLLARSAPLRAGCLLLLFGFGTYRLLKPVRRGFWGLATVAAVGGLAIGFLVLPTGTGRLACGDAPFSGDEHLDRRSFAAVGRVQEVRWAYPGLRCVEFSYDTDHTRRSVVEQQIVWGGADLVRGAKIQVEVHYTRFSNANGWIEVARIAGHRRDAARWLFIGANPHGFELGWVLLALGCALGMRVAVHPGTRR